MNKEWVFLIRMKGEAYWFDGGLFNLCPFPRIWQTVIPNPKNQLKIAERQKTLPYLEVKPQPNLSGLLHHMSKACQILGNGDEPSKFARKFNIIHPAIKPFQLSPVQYP